MSYSSNRILPFFRKPNIMKLDYQNASSIIDLYQMQTIFYQ